MSNEIANTNESLVDNLNRTLAVVNKNYEISKKYNELTNQRIYNEKREKTLSMIRWGIPIVFLTLFWITDKDFILLKVFIGLPLVFFVSMLVSGIANRIASPLLSKHFYEEMKRDREANSQVIDSLTNEFNSNLRLLDKFSNVPPAYRYKGAVELFMHYIVNKRADNIKEAIHIFEQEMQHRRLVQEIRQMQANQYYLMQDLQDVKYAAQRAESAARNAEYASWIGFIR